VPQGHGEACVWGDTPAFRCSPAFTLRDSEDSEFGSDGETGQALPPKTCPNRDTQSIGMTVTASKSNCTNAKPFLSNPSCFSLVPIMKTNYFS